MVKEVWPYLIVGTLLTIVLAWMAPPVFAVLSGIVTAGVAGFFRDPHREIRPDPRLILSPADGTVVAIGHGPEGSLPGTRCVSIFLSVFNVHVNRSPVAGRIAGIQYTPGAFLPAFRDKASMLNEQNLIAVDTTQGPLAVKQIAGLIARRIHCWKRPGDTVNQGEKIGFITFGSRVDLFIPPEAKVMVARGDKVRGGMTIMAVYPEGEDSR